MKRLDAWIVWLYGAAFTIFIAHSIDSTRFAEWTLFRMSAEAYVVAYLPVTAVALYGLVALDRRRDAGYAIAVVYGLGYAAAIAVHGPQLAGRTDAFHTPLSVGLILSLTASGVALAVAALWRILAARRRSLLA